MSGPAIIEMPNTTVLVPPKTTARMGHYREIYLEGNANGNSNGNGRKGL
jgi:hypothetical protein